LALASSSSDDSKSMKTLQTMACAIAFAMPHVVGAQANQPEKGSAATTASKLTYKSAFHDYRPYEDVPVAGWRPVNDTVRHAAAKGTVPWEWNGDMPEPARASAPQADARTLRVQKPTTHNH
jgi:hypothetical protein